MPRIFFTGPAGKAHDELTQAFNSKRIATDADRLEAMWGPTVSSFKVV